MGRKGITRLKPNRKMQKTKPGPPEVHNHEPLPPGCALYLFRSWAMLNWTCPKHAAGRSPALPTLHSSQICVVLNRKWSGHCQPGTRDKPVGFAVSWGILNGALKFMQLQGHSEHRQDLLAFSCRFILSSNTAFGAKTGLSRNGNVLYKTQWVHFPYYEH